MSALLQFPLVSGLQEGVDPKTAPAGTVSTLVNAAWTKDGRLDKRDGTKLVGVTGAPASALRLATRNGELCIVDGASFYSWSSKLGQWVNRGAVPELALESKPLTATVTGIQASDVCALNDGRMVHAWVSGDPTASTQGSVYYEILDPATGARSVQQVIVNAQGAAFMVRLVTDGTNWALVWVNSSTGNISAVVNGGAVTALSSTGDAQTATPGPFDVCDTGNGFVVAYAKAAGGIELRRYLYALGAAQASVAITGEVATDYIAISIDGRTTENLWIGYARSPNAGPVRIAIHNADTLVSVVGATGIDATANTLFRRVGVRRVDATHFCLAYSMQGQAGSTYVDGAARSMIINSAGAVTNSTIRVTFGCILLTRPFLVGGNLYAFFADAGQSSAFSGYGTSGFPTYPGTNAYLVQIDTAASTSGIGTFPHRYIGFATMLTSGTWAPGHLSNVAAASATKLYATLPAQEAGVTKPTGWQQGATLYTITKGADMPADVYASVEIGGEAYFAGALLMAYDGRRPFDFGFPRGSYIDKVSSGMTGSGGSLAAGDYQFALVPEFRSAAGVLHRGPGSPAIKFTAAASDKMTLAWIPQTLAYKDTIADPIAADNDALRVVSLIYRTTVGSGTLQKRSVEPIVPGVNTEINSTGAAPNKFIDSSSDNTLNLAAQPVIYDVDEYDDYPPTSLVSLRLHRRRMFALLGDRRTLAYSKDYAENVGTAPGFNPAGILVGFDEDLVGMATLDDKFVAGSTRAFYVFFGDGPAVNGDGGYDPPTKIATDVGFSNPRAIVATPDGVIFQSPRGIHILTRKLEVFWIGKPIQDTLAAYPNITSAVLVATKNQVRFTANAANGATGVVLVYDYVRKGWAVFKYTDTQGAIASTPIADACMWNGVWTFVTPTGVAYSEDTTTALDGGATWVEKDVELAENFATGPLGYQRVRRAGLLGARVTDCNVRVRIATNGRAAYDQDHTFTSDVIATEGVNLTRVVKVQKNGSIRVRFTDATPTAALGSGYVPTVGAGRGVTLSAVGFEIEPLDGMKRRPAKAVA